MRLNILLTTLVLGMGASATPFHAQKVLNSSKITSFDDFIATKQELTEYYGNINYLVGDELIKTLEPILENGQIKINYSGKNDSPIGNWGNYLLADRDYSKSPLSSRELNILNNDSNPKAWWDTRNIICNIMYEQESRDFNSCSGLNREHVYPKSLGFNKKKPNENYFESTMVGCDIHNLHMADGPANMLHSNDPYGNVNKSSAKTSKSKNTSIINGYSGTSLTTGVTAFEPLDKDKGDIARSIFYMATRYHTYDPNRPDDPALRLTTYGVSKGTHSPDETKNGSIKYGILDDLIEWNIEDPITNNEKIRNSLVNNYIQHNRNPYADFPLWADVAFNYNSIYYADISKPDGVDYRFKLKNEELFDNNYFVAIPLKTADIKFNFVDSSGLKTLNYNDVKTTLIDLKTNDAIDVSNKNELLFTKAGQYKLTFKYDSHPRVLEANINVLPLEGDQIIVNDLLPNELIKGDVLDFNTLDIQSYIDKKTAKIDNNDPNLSFIIKNIDTGTEIKVDSNLKYNVDAIGNYQLIINYKNNGKIITFTHDFTVKELKDISNFEGLDILNKEYYSTDTINFENLKLKYSINNEETLIPYDKFKYEFKNENKEIVDTVSGEKINSHQLKLDYKFITISYESELFPGQIVEITSPLKIKDFLDTIKVFGTQNIKNKYYEGDTMFINDVEITYHYNNKTYEIPFNKLEFYLEDVETKNQERVYNTTELEPGEYNLIIKYDHPSSSAKLEYILDHTIIVASLSDTIEIQNELLSSYEVDDVLDVSKITISYLQNNKRVTIKNKDLNFILKNVSTNKIIPEDNRTFKLNESGTYKLTISYDTPYERHIETSRSFKVNGTDVVEENPINNKTMVLIIVGASSVVIIVSIILIIVGIKKNKRRR